MHVIGGRWRAAIITAGLAAAAYVGMAFVADAGRFSEGVRRISLPVLAALLGLSAVNYALRAVRWRHFLAHLGHRLPWRAAAMNYVAGFALTTTPGKAGEAVRSVLLKRDHGTPVVDSLAAFFAERFSDVIALVMLGGIALAVLPAGKWMAAIAAACTAIALFVATSESRTRGFAALLSRFLPHRFVAPFTSLLGQAGRLARGRVLATGLALSLVAWLAEAWALHLIVAEMGFKVDVVLAMGIYCAALIGGALFLLPGGLGSTEAILYALLMAAGLDAGSAAAATVVSRVTTLWFAVALGWPALVVASRERRAE